MPTAKELHHQKLLGTGGEMTVYAASMFAGKTGTLIREILKYQRAEIPTLVFKHSLDDRYSGVGELTSHDGLRVPCEAYADPYVIYRRVQEVDPLVVAIDEAQFFMDESADRLAQVLARLVGEGRVVIVAGFELGFRGRGFGAMGQLMAQADKVEKLTAVCAVCGSTKANRTQRLINGKPASYNDPVVLVGAAEAYEARCAVCHEVPDAPSIIFP